MCGSGTVLMGEKGGIKRRSPSRGRPFAGSAAPNPCRVRQLSWSSCAIAPRSPKSRRRRMAGHGLRPGQERRKCSAAKGTAGGERKNAARIRDTGLPNGVDQEPSQAQLASGRAKTTRSSTFTVPQVTADATFVSTPHSTQYPNTASCPGAVALLSTTQTSAGQPEACASAITRPVAREGYVVQHGRMQLPRRDQDLRDCFSGQPHIAWGL